MRARDLNTHRGFLCGPRVLCCGFVFLHNLKRSRGEGGRSGALVFVSVKAAYICFVLRVLSLTFRSFPFGYPVPKTKLDLAQIHSKLKTRDRLHYW